MIPIASHVCPECSEHWPNQRKYFTCPRCEIETMLLADEQAIPTAEADMLLARYDGFKRWLARHPNLRFPQLDLSRYDLVSPDMARELSEIPTLEEAA